MEWIPTRAAGLARLAEFVPAAGRAYADRRNLDLGPQDRSNVSALSPWLRRRMITEEEVVTAVLRQHSAAAAEKFIQEVAWRTYWKGWLELRPAMLDRFNADRIALKAELARDRALAARFARATDGATGIACFDTWVEELRSLGWLHNHARMWLASYVVHVRKVHWRAGADWLAAHLLDGDLASNHLSWQWVAGTGSSKPYLFNAENVARFAPAHWHSPGTVIDRSYEELDRIARGLLATEDVRSGARGNIRGPRTAATPEPALHTQPTEDPGIQSLDEAGLAALARYAAGREVWLVHPWALRAPPSDLPAGAAVVGIYLHDHHQAWPWPETRWRWVDAAMAQIAPQRWHGDAATLARALGGAARVRSIDDPHIARWLSPFVQLDPAPCLFPAVERSCQSFSQWWSRATRGLRHAQGLL